MLKLYDTLQNSKVDFIPLNDDEIKVYVCGPTVYSFPHIGNARSVVVYDLLFRVLRYVYKKVIYVRNITDVDDKIISAAKKENKSVGDLTHYYTTVFQQDMRKIGCLQPTFEPKATDHITNIINLIEKLLSKKHAYTVNGSVYFDVLSYHSYGKLSGRKLDDLVAGSRVKIDYNKRNPSDFILWKPDNEYGWDSPWGYGRPGWHIECSAMSTSYLGVDFDIHGGGVDLQFPHHENEIAQSCAAHPSSGFARYWIHNGFVLLNGKKMSKSLGNVLIINDLLESGVAGVIIKYALLSTHYRKPLDWTDDLLQESTNIINKFFSIAQRYCGKRENLQPFPEIINDLCDDLNILKAIARLHQCVRRIEKGDEWLLPAFIGSLNFLGLLDNHRNEIDVDIQKLIDKRKAARERRDFIVADKIRSYLLDIGIEISDEKDGTVTWNRILKI